MAAEEKQDGSPKKEGDDASSSYRRLKLLGQGSFGKAFLARDLTSNEVCVMKQIHVEKMDAKARDTAVREAVALRKVRHPNVVGFRQVFVKSGWLCLVMDFADGGDLCAAVKERARQKVAFEESAIFECFGQVADAVNYVHGLKMVHRDIKSRNIFLCRTGRALLGDFGLVRLLEDTCELAHTRVGTPYYLSPEIIRKQPYNYKTDIWSLGVLLYEMAALTRPFVGTLATLPASILKGTYEPLGPQYSAGLHALVAGFLAVNPAERMELRDALEGALQAPLQRARDALRLEPAAPIERRKKAVPRADPLPAPAAAATAGATLAPPAGATPVSPPVAQVPAAATLLPPPAGATPATPPAAQVPAAASLAPPAGAPAPKTSKEEWIGFNTMVRRAGPILPAATGAEGMENWSAQAARDPESDEEGLSGGSSDSWGTVVETGIPDALITAAEKAAGADKPT